MRITETTPPPVERTFTLEVTESELRVLKKVLGDTNTVKHPGSFGIYRDLDRVEV